MIKSMTGSGSAEGVVGDARVSVEIRSVNHRFFNPSIKLPSDLAKWEGEVREAMRKAVARGRVSLFARVERRESDSGRIDEEQFRAYVEQIRKLQEQLVLGASGDVGAILRVPNVIAAPDDEVAGTAAELVEIVDRALVALDQMRSAEG